MTNAEYIKALDYLNSFIDYGSTHAESLSPHKFDLQRMQELMGALNNPPQAYGVVHVAGTKGKGSVCALCASALKAAGYRVGLYTSPHLQDFTERIQVDNQPITGDEFALCVHDLKPHVDKIPGITYFEITTAIGFYHFRNKGVDYAVLEVGLGGRLDATNIVNPIVSVITSLSYDHTYVLGDTLSQIAGEKAGIIKDGVPVIMAPQVDEARKVIHQIGLNRHSRVIEVDKDISCESLERDLEGQRFRLQIAEGSKLDQILETEPQLEYLRDLHIWIPLLGDHQIENAAVAFATLVVLSTKGLSIDLKAIKTGFATVEWPGRFEIYRHEPVVVLDSAHNKHSASILRKALDDYLPEGRVILIFGASGDKDVLGMLDVLKPRVMQVIATRSSHPRAMEIEQIISTCTKLGLPVFPYENIKDALESAIKSVRGDDVIVVTGSLFIVGEARTIMKQMCPLDMGAEI